MQAPRPKVHNVELMGSMFSGAAAFDQPIGKWEVHNVEDMSYMFSGAADCCRGSTACEKR